MRKHLQKQAANKQDSLAALLHPKRGSCTSNKPTTNGFVSFFMRKHLQKQAANKQDSLAALLHPKRGSCTSNKPTTNGFVSFFMRKHLQKQAFGVFSHKKKPTQCVGFLLAERKGFEPSIQSPIYTLSKRAPSATRPPL